MPLPDEAAGIAVGRHLHAIAIESIEHPAETTGAKADIVRGVRW
ncbi:MAG: hypothetical protein P8M18_06735 [Woeseiaceae bacterium]|nr:hypothetical protein [Woeseiaceae bacterium]